MKVRLLCDRAGARLFFRKGSEIELEPRQAEALIKAGQAELIEPEPPEIAAAPAEASTEVETTALKESEPRDAAGLDTQTNDKARKRAGDSSGVQRARKNRKR